MIWCIKTYIIAYVKTHTHTNWFIIHCIKPTAQLYVDKYILMAGKLVFSVYIVTVKMIG